MTMIDLRQLGISANSTIWKAMRNSQYWDKRAGMSWELIFIDLFFLGVLVVMVIGLYLAITHTCKDEDEDEKNGKAPKRCPRCGRTPGAVMVYTQPPSAADIEAGVAPDFLDTFISAITAPGCLPPTIDTFVQPFPRLPTLVEEDEVDDEDEASSDSGMDPNSVCTTGDDGDDEDEDGEEGYLRKPGFLE